MQRMQPAWVGAQGGTECQVWSTVLQPAAAELADRARELADAVVGSVRERLPDLSWTMKRSGKPPAPVPKRTSATSPRC